MLTPEDEITGSEDLINLPEVRERIKMLKPFHVENTRIPESALADPSIASYATREEAEAHVAVHGPGVRDELEIVEWSDEAEELAALRELEAELSHLAASDHTSAINEDYLDTFVRDELDDAHGADTISALDPYLAWDAIQLDRVAGLSRISYRGGTYYLVP